MSVETIVQMILAFVGKYPVTASIIAIMGTARLIMKPIMVALHSIADATGSLKDNQILEGLEGNKIYKLVVFILDYAVSIKIPASQPSVPAPVAVKK